MVSRDSSSLNSKTTYGLTPLEMKISGAKEHTVANSELKSLSFNGEEKPVNGEGGNGKVALLKVADVSVMAVASHDLSDDVFQTLLDKQVAKIKS